MPFTLAFNLQFYHSQLTLSATTIQPPPPTHVEAAYSKEDIKCVGYTPQSIKCVGYTPHMYHHCLGFLSIP